MRRFDTAPSNDANRCSWRADLKRRMTFSRTRVGSCAFSALVLPVLDVQLDLEFPGFRGDIVSM